MPTRPHYYNNIHLWPTRGRTIQELAGKDWVNVEEMIRKINRFVTQEDESVEKVRMELGGPMEVE